MSEIDRDSFLETLERLLSENDEEVLASARAIKAQMAEAGVSWDMLLVQAPGDDEHEDEDLDEDEAEDEAGAGLGRATSAPSDDLALIEQLLASPDLSPETREELEEYKEDIAEGEFTDSDHRYLQLLHQRVTGKKR